MADFLRGLRGTRVALTCPQRGERARVRDLAADNAREAFRLRFRHPRRDVDRVAEAVAASLELPGPVRRIECFDVSHLQGEAQVVSLVVWENGRMAKGEYRSFNVRAGQAADDPAAIGEAVRRRYARRVAESQPLPDLVLIDGGAAQLAAARHALAELGCALPVAALAKRLEEIYLPDRRQPLQLGGSHPVRLLLQQVRDEAHRFAVTRHRRRRKARRMATQLLAIPGIGPTRAQKLLTHFGSLDGVRAASQDALAEAVGQKVAASVHRALHEADHPMSLPPIPEHRPRKVLHEAQQISGSEDRRTRSAAHPHMPGCSLLIG